MRGTIVVFVLAGLGGLYLWQQKADEKKPATSTSVVQKSGTTSTSTSAATPAGEPSEHNWMKRSLDRARDVRDQARSRTKEGQDP